MSEVLVIAVVALVAVGPEKLPGMLRTLGVWIRKAKKMSTDIRAQSGIDEILRAEGLQGGVSELKSLIRSAQSPFVNLAATVATSATDPSPQSAATPAQAPTPAADPPLVSGDLAPQRYEDPYANLDVDPTREYPPEGPDAYGALPDDLFDPESADPGPLDVLSSVPDLTNGANGAPEAPAPAGEAGEVPAPPLETRRELDPSSPS